MKKPDKKNSNKNLTTQKPDKTKKTNKATLYAEEFIRYIAPIPPPELMKKYEELYPGAVKYFFESLKKQTNHRIRTENIVVGSNITSETRGSWFAFIITMTALLGGFALTALGFNVAGIISAVAGLAGLVIVFITGKNISKKELSDKRKRIENNT